MTSSKEALGNLVKKTMKILAPPPDLTVSEWADAERRLSAESSAEPGRWRCDRNPAQTGVMDAMTEPGVGRVVGMMSAQVGKTEGILNMLGYVIHLDPSPMMVVQPTLDMAEAFSKDRLAPMLRDTPALKEKVRDPRARDSGNTLLQKKFPGGHVTMSGANSPASLASRPIRIVLCDETDRYPASAGSEGDPVKLAQKRAATFFNRLFIEFSTPTIKGISRIEKSFEESDKRFFHLPCPLCGHMQVLKFEQMLWESPDSKTPENVRYKCVSCSETFDESHKMEMLRKGKWIATAPFRGTAGFHLWEAYSPWKHWHEIIAEFLEVKDDPERLKVWMNTSKGETFEIKGDAPEWKRLFERRERYPMGKIPARGLFLTAGADVQKDRIECEIVAWGRDKQSWSIDYVTFEGDTATEEPWKQLTELLSKQWAHPSGLMLPIRMLAVDSGYNSQHVYNWARTHPRSRVMATKGSDTAATIVGSPSNVDVRMDGKRIRRGFRLWIVGVSIAKAELYSWLKLETPSDGKPYPLGFCHYPEYAEEYFQQLTAECLKEKLVKGQTRYYWEKTRERNEALDCRVLARAAAAVVGMDRFTPEQWDAMAKEMGYLRPAAAPVAEDQRVVPAEIRGEPVEPESDASAPAEAPPQTPPEPRPKKRRIPRSFLS
jgi:phage terminase large subunit GpA-like protein